MEWRKYSRDRHRVFEDRDGERDWLSALGLGPRGII